MSERDGFQPGVPSWVDHIGSDPTRLGEGGRVVVPPYDLPSLRQAVLADPSGATFSATQLMIGS